MRMNFRYLIWIAIGAMFLASCASFKPQAKDDVFFTVPLQSHTPEYELYLIGDGGGAPMGESTILFDHLKKEFSLASAKSSAVWLGDNIYPVGVPPKDSPEWPLAKHRLLAQLQTLDNYKGGIYFMPGNHDWYTYGLEGIKRQEYFIEEYLVNLANKETSDFFYPSQGCGDIKVVELDKERVLLIFDSQWFISKVDKYDFSHCEISDRQSFEKRLNEIVKSYSDKTVIFASHHPIYTYGQHGGKTSKGNHFFPLRQINPKLWIPFPIAGTAVGIGRTRVTEQDVKHVANKYYQQVVKEAMDQTPKAIYASGHEHCLQLINRDDRYYVVSGSASKKEAVGMGEGSLFAYAQHGYCKISFYSNQDPRIEFFALDEKKRAIVPVFSGSLDF